MKIAVAGTGYVGLSIATLLSQKNEVMAVDIIPEKVELINNRKSPIQDEYIEKYLAEKKLNLVATMDNNLDLRLLKYDAKPVKPLDRAKHKKYGIIYLHSYHIFTFLSYIIFLCNISNFSIYILQ